MSKHSPLIAVVFLLSLMAISVAPSSAQSVIAGVVKDTTGAVLPGVTVEASSDALIERVRSVTTDEAGQYRLENLRPGTYTLTFALAGFNTVRREGIELAASFTATINAEMRVGAVEETITVSGISPIVDVQQTQHSQTLTRELLDAIPATHNVNARAQLIPGIRLSAPEVGGSRAMQQTYMSVHGGTATANIYQVDGMIINVLESNGQCQQYINDAMNQEVTYETAGASAETSGGGARINMIPREGGNRVSGDIYQSYSNGWQSDNLTPRLTQLGLRSVNKIDKIYDFNVAVGGPLVRDNLWLFGTFRRWATNRPLANVFYKDGSVGIDDNYLMSTLARITWQASPRNKLSAFMDRTFKERFHAANAGDEIETTALHWRSPNYSTAQVKWTSPVTRQVLLEAGESIVIQNYSRSYQDGVGEPAFTPLWYAHATTRDTTLGTRRGAAQFADWIGSYRYATTASLAWITGSHAVRAGVQYMFGGYRRFIQANGDIEQNYAAGVPTTVLAYNTPVADRDRLNYDTGVFAQDSWKVRRLSINGGIRFEWLNGGVVPSTVPAGRFVPVRQVAERNDLPNWFNASPRFGVAYDLFGDGKTAIKFSVNKYMEQYTYGLAQSYNPMAFTSASLPWTDPNGNGIAEDSELDFARLPTNFGARALNTPDPDLKRPWNLLATVEGQRELLTGLAVGGGWYRRSSKNQFLTQNTLRRLSDYSPLTIVNPLDGLPITVYNLNSASLVSQVANLDTNDPAHSIVYSGYEVSFRAKLWDRTQFFGGWTSERTVDVNCSSPDNPNSFRFCNQDGLDRESGVTITTPYVQEMKIAGSHSLPYGFRVSGSLKSSAGSGFSYDVPVSWVLTRSTRYPNSTELSRLGISGVCTGCEALAGQLVAPTLIQASQTVRLNPPGTRLKERVNLFDMTVAKQFGLGAGQFEVRMDVFNLLNADTIIAQNTNFGISYGTPTTVLDGRYVQVAAHLKF